MGEIITGIISFLKLNTLTWKKFFMLICLIFVVTAMFSLYKAVPEGGLYYDSEGIGLGEPKKDNNEKITEGTENTNDDYN